PGADRAPQCHVIYRVPGGQRAAPVEDDRLHHGPHLMRGTQWPLRLGDRGIFGYGTCMSGLQFIVDFVKALAWPAALVAIVAFLRRPIVDILMQLASGLRRLRSGKSDAQVDRVA